MRVSSHYYFSIYYLSRGDPMLTMLKTLRKQKRLTQRELADALHISQTSVSKYERGESEPDLEMVVLMADFFGVTVDSFLRVSDNA